MNITEFIRYNIFRKGVIKMSNKNNNDQNLTQGQGQGQGKKDQIKNPSDKGTKNDASNCR